MYGMADRAGAISNSLSAVFPGTTSNSILKAKGYFHVKKGLKDNKLRFSTEENYIKFEKDCRDVAGSETKEEFEHMVHLLAAKWRSREGDAVKWFLKEWCSEQYGTWYSGFTHAGLPNTNNSVERFNSALKRYVTKRRRLPVLPEDCFTCNCPPYLQYATCKHALGLASLQEACCPSAIEGKQGRGFEPKKVGYCLSKK